jgi:integrase
MEKHLMPGRKPKSETRERVNLTKTEIGKLRYAEKGEQVIYWDVALDGFGLRVTNRSKSFVAQRMVKGTRKVRRVSIGRFPQVSPETAKVEAQRYLSDMSLGKDPKVAAEKARTETMTLKDVFEDYMTNAELKPNTAYMYRNQMNAVFQNWLGKPITDITREKVEELHRTTGKSRLGKAYTNGAFRVLRAVLYYAIDKAEGNGVRLLPFNPVRKLAWFKIKRRDDYVPASELPIFFANVAKLGDETMRDYFLLILFTGLRRDEAAGLTWRDLNFTSKTVRIPDTKNNEPFTFPMSDYVHDLLKRRKEGAGDSAWVFPGTRGDGRTMGPKRAIKAVCAGTSLKCTHGLRRTFATIANSLFPSSYTVKRLLNHKAGADVTAGYLMEDPEQLREAVNKIAYIILSKGGVAGGAKVIKIHRGNG